MRDPLPCPIRVPYCSWCSQCVPSVISTVRGVPSVYPVCSLCSQRVPSKDLKENSETLNIKWGTNSKKTRRKTLYPAPSVFLTFSVCPLYDPHCWSCSQCVTCVFPIFLYCSEYVPSVFPIVSVHISPTNGLVRVASHRLHSQNTRTIGKQRGKIGKTGNKREHITTRDSIGNTGNNGDHTGNTGHNREHTRHIYWGNNGKCAGNKEEQEGTHQQHWDQ